MGLIKEFREFALKGNMIDLAVGVIIGGAFGSIVNSLISDVIMPVVGIAGNVDFKNAYLPLTKSGVTACEAASKAGAPLTLDQCRAHGPVLAWGSFVTVAVNFLILALCIFIVVKVVNTARKRFEAEKPVPAPAGPTPDQKLLTEIRDQLARR